MRAILNQASFFKVYTFFPARAKYVLRLMTTRGFFDLLDLEDAFNNLLLRKRFSSFTKNFGDDIPDGALFLYPQSDKCRCPVQPGRNADPDQFIVYGLRVALFFLRHAIRIHLSFSRYRGSAEAARKFSEPDGPSRIPRGLISLHSANPHLPKHSVGCFRDEQKW